MKRSRPRGATWLQQRDGTVERMFKRLPESLHELHEPQAPGGSPTPPVQRRPSRIARLLRSLLLGLFPLIGTLLFGCSSESDFQRDGDTWRYRGQPINDADAKSFKVLDAHHAKDQRQAWFADTDRKGQEYFLVRHVVVRRIEGADAASFAVLKSGYARDRANVYFEGRRFAVADVASFEVLDYDFARDQRQGYYERKPIAGSQGSSFKALDVHHAADATRVYFVPQRSDPEHAKVEAKGANAQTELQPRVVQGAELASFEVLGAAWARDAKTLFYAGRRVSADPESFQTLDRGYTRTASGVFYLGQPVLGAKAPSFEVFASVDEADGADARDAQARYARGAAVKPVGRAAPSR